MAGTVSISPCGVCTTHISNEKAMLCICCRKWHHIKCINITETAYNALNTAEDNGVIGLSWYCSSCVPKINTFIEVCNDNDNNNETLREEIKAIEGKAEKVEKIEDINANDIYKDRLIAALYSDVEFLKYEICEKNKFLGTLLPKNLNDIKDDTLSDEKLVNFEVSNQIQNETESGEIGEIKEKKIINQLKQVRLKMNDDYNYSKGKYLRTNTDGDKSRMGNLELSDQLRELNNKWPDNTILIAGDSMLYGIDEKRLKKNSKVRVFPGSTIEELKMYITPLLYKKPKTLILQIGTNNCKSNNSIQIKEKYIDLIEYIKHILPDCKIVCSSLIKRYDDAKAQMTVNMCNNKLKELDIDYIDNGNINETHLGKKGLHLNSYGIGKLALNFIKYMKDL